MLATAVNGRVIVAIKINVCDFRVCGYRETTTNKSAIRHGGAIKVDNLFL